MKITDARVIVSSPGRNYVTLVIETEDGKPTTLTVGPQVKRLNEIKAGDTVTAGYYISIASDFREATDE